MKSVVNHEAGELVVSWEQYHGLVERLALMIHAHGCRFEQVVALSRGGLRVGDVISRLFDRPLVVMAASSYGGDGDREQGDLCLGHSLAHTCASLGPNLLVVDDLVDSGRTLAACNDWLRACVQPESITTAVLWLKQRSCLRPDIWATELPANPWILQPFEIYERLTPANLARSRAARS